jgi:putative membrane protein
MQPLLSDTERERIQAAVQAAEERTAGEIVPFILSRSGGYEVAIWRGAAGAAVLTMGVAMVVMQLYEGWGLSWLYASWGVILLTLLAGTLGAGLVAISSPLQRWLAGRALIEETVHRRAMQAFVEEEVFATRDRTGILIFVSLFEHHIEVLGDAGINQRVQPEAWVSIVEHLRDSIRQGRLADGLVQAIDECGALLEQRGVELRSDDENELSDRVRVLRREERDGE